MGGEASRVSEEGKDIAELARTNLEAASKVGGNISNIDSAINALQRGADAGTIYNNMPRLDEASASLQNAMHRMGLDVIGSVTFGALSAGELRLAMETAAPRNLNSEELLKWMQRRREAQVKARAGLLEAAEYFANGGSVAGWVERVKSMSDGSSAGTEGGSQSSNGTGQGNAGQSSNGGLPPAPEGVSPDVWPEYWENMTPEERALFQ
jgi:hypothetical protein